MIGAGCCRLLPATAAAVLLLGAVACSGGNRAPSPPPRASPVRSSTGATPAAAEAAGVNPSPQPGTACSYEQQVQAAALPFALAVLDAGEQAGGAPGPATAADLTRAIAALDTSVQTLVTKLGTIVPPVPLQQYHRQLIAGFAAAEPLIGQARAQAAQGAIVAAQQSVIAASAQIQAAGDTQQQDFPALSAQLSACPS